MNGIKKVLSVLLAVLVCGLCFVPALALEDPETCEHDWGWVTDAPATCGPGMQHMYCPKCGSVKDEGTAIPGTGEHSWQWVVDMPPTRYNPGVQHEECSVCHLVRSQNTAIPATEQGFDFGAAMHQWIDIVGNYFLNIINQIRALFSNARG